MDYAGRRLLPKNVHKRPWRWTFALADELVEYPVIRDRASEIMEKQYGNNGPTLASSFTEEANRIRRMGHEKEAEMLDQRVAKLQPAAQQ